jgi:hypothetical protein
VDGRSQIVRDSLFLSRFPTTELPYVYLLAALLASAVIGIYSRHISKLSLSQNIRGSQAFIVCNVIFWLLITYYDFGWVLYGFYMWSAIVFPAEFVNGGGLHQPALIEKLP